MSLINQMLKDLEQRNASDEGLKPVSGDVRTVAGESGSPSLPVILASVCLLLLAGGGLWWKLAYVPAQESARKAAMLAQMPVPTPPAKPAVVAEAPPAPAAVPANSMRLPGLDTELRTTPIVRPRIKKDKDVAGTSDAVSSDGTVLPPLQEKLREVRLGKALPAAPGSSLKSTSTSQKSDNLYRQAVALIQQGRVSEARTALELSLQDNPSNHDARQLLVGLLIENKRTAEALPLLQDGVRIAPDQTGFVMALARLQVEAGERNAALLTMEQGAKFAEEDAEFHGFYAALMQREDRHEEAVTHYLKALNADPANTSWLVGVGISLQSLGRFADAREAFGRARDVGQMTPELSDFVDQRLRQLKGK